MLKVSLVSIGLLLFISLPAVSQTISEPCRVLEERGCFGYEIISIDHSESREHQLVKERIAGKDSWEDDISLRLYKEWKAGEVSLRDDCVSYWVYAWNHSSVPLEHIAQYDGDPRKPTPVTYATDAPDPQAVLEGKSLGKPTVYRARFCSGLGAVQFPDAFYTNDTHVLICPIEIPGEPVTLVPNKHPGNYEGTWHTAQNHRWYRSQGWTWVISSWIRP